MTKINLGCGTKLLRGYINVDVLDHKIVREGQTEHNLMYVKEDAFIYLTKTKHDSVDTILMEHFIEHFEAGEVITLLNLAYIVLKPGGILKVVVPHKDSERSYVLTHRSFYNEYTFKALERDDQENYNIPNFKVVKIITNDRPDIHVWLQKN